MITAAQGPTVQFEKANYLASKAPPAYGDLRIASAGGALGVSLFCVSERSKPFSIGSKEFSDYVPLVISMSLNVKETSSISPCAVTVESC